MLKSLGQVLHDKVLVQCTPALLYVRKHPWRFLCLVIAVVIAFEYLTLPNNSLMMLRRRNPKITALMEQRIDEFDSKGKKLIVQQRWVPISKISPHLLHAVIVAEDGTFYEHAGVDWYEIEESIEKNLEKGRTARGASTISQQLSKNLYLSTSKTPLRKLKELVITLRIERMLSKRRILELYLNIIEWGPGIFGVEAASRKYFNKPAAELSRDEAIRMASVIPSPLRHQPNTLSRYVVRRSEIIERRMSTRGY